MPAPLAPSRCRLVVTFARLVDLVGALPRPLAAGAGAVPLLALVPCLAPVGELETVGRGACAGVAPGRGRVAPAGRFDAPPGTKKSPASELRLTTLAGPDGGWSRGRSPKSENPPRPSTPWWPAPAGTVNPPVGLFAIGKLTSSFG